MSTVKQRVMNVFYWLAFIYFLFFLASFVIENHKDEWALYALVGGFPWALFIAINYIAYGQFRFFPWQYDKSRKLEPEQGPSDKPQH